MNNHEVDVGDVVTLNSGGPPMTVMEKKTVDQRNSVLVCAWISTAGEPHVGDFPTACCKKWQPNAGPLAG